MSLGADFVITSYLGGFNSFTYCIQICDLIDPKSEKLFLIYVSFFKGKPNSHSEFHGNYCILQKCDSCIPATAF